MSHFTPNTKCTHYCDRLSFALENHFAGEQHRRGICHFRIPQLSRKRWIIRRSQLQQNDWNTKKLIFEHSTSSFLCTHTHSSLSRTTQAKALRPECRRSETMPSITEIDSSLALCGSVSVAHTISFWIPLICCSLCQSNRDYQGSNIVRASRVQFIQIFHFWYFISTVVYKFQ